MQRVGLLTFVNSLQNSILPKVATEKLANKIIEMEMIVNVVKPKDNEVSEDKRIKRCRYYNVGFCKMNNDCVFYLSDEVCDQYLKNGKCSEYKLCLKWHPKECKYWLKDPRGCFRGQECRFQHNLPNKGKKIKESKNRSCDMETGAAKPKIIPEEKSDNIEEKS